MAYITKLVLDDVLHILLFTTNDVPLTFFLGDQRKQHCNNGSTGQNIMTEYSD